MFGCDSVFYYPNRVKYSSPQQYRLGYESVSFHAADGVRLHGWFFPAAGEARGTVLHLHGNAGNITGHFEHIIWLPGKGWNVLCFDYRGYGSSEGRVTRAGTITDARAALDYLLRRPDVEASRIVALGQSLGGAIGIVLAAEREEIRGLAVDGAFDNYRRITWWHIKRNPILLIVGWWVPGVLISKGYEPIDYVGKIAPRRLFIMQGTKDKVVDPRTAGRLYDAAGEPKELWMIEGADHYEAMQDLADEVHPRLLAFLEKCIE
ncbi:MAG: alpha/beta hydrolase [Planctomycetota bacterium]|jgi:fermentation-respiration switch protein FrsA (DUF1100 family)